MPPICFAAYRPAATSEASRVISIPWHSCPSSFGRGVVVKHPNRWKGWLPPALSSLKLYGKSVTFTDRGGVLTGRIKLISCQTEKYNLQYLPTIYFCKKVGVLMSESKWKLRLDPETPVEVIGDDPFTNDFLNHKDSVIRLCELIEQVIPPFTLGVYGEWGSGKTSFMKMLQAQMKKSESFETFWFDAWEYENESSLLLPLLSRLAKTTGKRQHKRLDSLRNVATGVLLAGGDAFLKHSTAGLLNLKDIQENYAKYEKDVADYYEKWISEIDKLKKEFSKVVDKIAGKKRALVIFVDDLDRCLPENVVKLFENIKHFIAIKDNRCIFIIGVDRHVLEKGIEARYGTNLISGSDYLRKIINLSFDVPICDEANMEFIIQIVKKHTEDDWYINNKREIEIFAKYFLTLGIFNPRMIKPIVLRYLIFLSILKSEEYYNEVIIQLLTYKEVFPDAYAIKKSHNLIGLFPTTTEPVLDSKKRQLSKKELSARSCAGFGEIGTNEIYKELRGFSAETTMKLRHLHGENLKSMNINHFKMIDFLYSLST